MRYERDTHPASFYQAKLKSIARNILADKCMFFLGAGASLGPKPSLPAAASLSREMAGECQLDWYDYIPLSTIAFYYESYFARDELNEFLVNRLRRPEIPPSPTMYKLIELLGLMETRGKTTFTITTNYDEKFERAYRETFNNREPETVIYQGAHDPHDRDAKLNLTPSGPLQRDALSWKPEQPTVLYKMHGCISKPQGKGLVITEEDYINFLTNALNEDDHDKTLLNYIKSEFGYRTILFVGYSLSDWNFRAIFKATVEKHKDRDFRSYAVQFRDPAQPMSALEKVRWESEANFWNEKKVDILMADAHEFMKDLLKVVREQGGFPPPPEAFHAAG